MTSVKAIDRLLPQTQCGECGYEGCLPYAEAIAKKNAPINRCPPGGAATIRALAELLAINPEPYLSNAKVKAPALARIREAECIGCTKCIKACPVDAIIGSGKLMHSIISTECTGCGLCVGPCPVDCIEWVPILEPSYDRDLARQRFKSKKARLLHEAQEKKQTYFEKRKLKNTTADRKAKQDYILQALARVQAKKARET